ncbi:hypothetical protein A1O7_06798 [Cladophialophora yegresii CBS 114405]|uniref:Letm1 RBD domain-containing protein n=1 Tax=Cladophialophora yegresii CBS 114405 TaxID=1182544 RepID=W9WD48_9EURO|nr:uncharacterized protein A1O7_06798 [Cladophialophora yegresii CBS 114405]EXJ56454.1 hypothetical protein A1O7_06798 [Cladophialophora yegresii CBS 114405]
MRGFDARLLSARGHRLSPRTTTSHTPFLEPAIRTWLVPCRASSAQSQAQDRTKSSYLERTTSNPATSCYEEKPAYPSIPLEGFVPTTPISERDLASTRPAKLETPTPLKQENYNDGQIPVGDRARWFFSLGKSYLAFYKTGFKNVWHNYKELRKIRAKVGNRTLEDVVKYGTSGSGAASGSVPVLTRKDYQLALRTRHDVGKLVPFSIVFAICGEFTPLVILAIGSAAVPYTCRIPKQEQGDFLRPVKIRPKYAAQVDRILGAATEESQQSQSGVGGVQNPNGSNIQWKQEFVQAYRLHVNPFSYPLPVLGRWWHRVYSRPRLRRHCDEVLCDTILVRREGGFARLSPREVFEWSLKYGLRTLTEYLDDLHREGVPIDPDSAELKKLLLPVVEAEAEYILAVDWERLSPQNHWLSVFRPIWPERPVTPDDVHLAER